MTVAELKAILDTLPDDMRVYVDHEPHGAHEAPELFTSPGFNVQTGLGNRNIPPSLTIISPASKGFDAAQARSHWRHITKASKT